MVMSADYLGTSSSVGQQFAKGSISCVVVMILRAEFYTVGGSRQELRLDYRVLCAGLEYLRKIWRLEYCVAREYASAGAILDAR